MKISSANSVQLEFRPREQCCVQPALSSALTAMVPQGGKITHQALVLPFLWVRPVSLGGDLNVILQII